MIRRKFRSSRPELALFHTSANRPPIRVRPGSPSTCQAPMQEPTMRTLGFRTHVLLTLLACGGVLAALGMPWSAGGPERESDGSIDHVIETLGRAVGAADGTAGHAALGSWDVVLTALLAFTAAMAVLCLTAALQGIAREGLRLGALATLALVAWKLVEHPGDELRQGALVAAASAVVLVVSAFAVASAPARRRRGPRFGHPGVFIAPPPPPRWDPSESTPPPGA